MLGSCSWRFLHGCHMYWQYQALLAVSLRSGRHIGTATNAGDMPRTRKAEASAALRYMTALPLSLGHRRKQDLRGGTKAGTGKVPESLLVLLPPSNLPTRTDTCADRTGSGSKRSFHGVRWPIGGLHEVDWVLSGMTSRSRNGATINTGWKVRIT